MNCKKRNHFFDADNIRYELVATNGENPFNWLFLPGGPGVDSSYLHSLAGILELPGNVWFVDFPGNGTNSFQIASDYNFDAWFDIFLPMISKFENPIVVGHSFGGMFPLCFPELEDILKGFVILNSVPVLWLAEAVSYAKQFNLPDFTQDMQKFIEEPNQNTFRKALDACMPYYFPAKSLDEGRRLLAGITCQYPPAVWWQRKALEMNFSAKWMPRKVPTLIISGTYDCVCPHYLFPRDARFKSQNIAMINIEDGGHMPWIENPIAVSSAIHDFSRSLALNVSSQKVMADL